MSSSAHLAVASGPDAAASGSTRVSTPLTSPRLVTQARVVAERPQDRIGCVLHGTYRIERLVAEGGMGAVFEAVHLRLQQRFALKVLEHHLAHNDEAYNRFRQEAEIAAALNHPNIVQVFDFNHDESGNPYMVMEYVEGTTLSDYVGGRKLPLRDALRVFEPLAHALDAAHRAGIVHRDLKPNNIMVRRGPTGALEVKLLDFGISKMRDGEDGMTSDNVVMGTPNYMSPEQARGKTKSVDARTDIFALGAILYEMLGGRRAFDQRTTPELLHAIVYEHPPELGSIRSDLSPAVSAAVSRCLAKAADDRFQNVREVVTALREAARPKARSTSTAPSPAPVPRGRRVALALGWVAAVAMTAVTAAVLVSRGGHAEVVVPPAAPEATAPSLVEEPEDPSPPPTYASSLATPGALLLSHGPALYRADRRGLTYWADPEAPELVRALPSASPATAVSRTSSGEVLVGQADGMVSRWDRELRETSWNRRIGEGAIVAVAAAADYLAVSTGTHVELLNGRTGRSLRRFPGRSAVVALLITRAPAQKLLVVRADVLEVYDADKRKRLAQHPLVGRAVSGQLVAEPADGPPELAVDFEQGQWRVRRRFRLASDRRGHKWRLDALAAERL